MFKNLRSSIGTKVAVVSATLLPIVARADATDPFTDALATATTKTGVYAAALVGLAAVAVVFMIGMKYVKKIAKAS